MQMSGSIDIDATPTAVWNVISNIEGAADHISAIHKIEVLARPTGASIKGLKWKETRTFAGRDATETMWITDARKPRFYETRAESHGAVYVSRFDIEKRDGGCTLTMSFDGKAVTFGAKVLWALTGWMMHNPMRKAITQDLDDIKAAVESG